VLEIKTTNIHNRAMLKHVGLTKFGEENSENRGCGLCPHPLFSVSHYFNCATSNMNKKNLITFVLFAYGISWLIWMPNVLAHNFDVPWEFSK